MKRNITLEIRDAFIVVIDNEAELWTVIDIINLEKASNSDYPFIGYLFDYLESKDE